MDSLGVNCSANHNSKKNITGNKIILNEKTQITGNKAKWNWKTNLWRLPNAKGNGKGETSDEMTTHWRKENRTKPKNYR